MGERELIIFIFLINIILLIFIVGVLVFIFQYRKRKIEHEKQLIRINEQHIKELLSSQLEVQKQTMVDIGKEIHDNLGQKLTLASIYLQQIPYNKSGKDITTQTSEINELLNEILRDLRQLSQSMVNPEFYELDLVGLLRKEVERVSRMTQVRVLFHTRETELKLNTVQRNAIFRIVQEFIQNSLKHSRCTQIDLTIERTEEKIKFEVSDNGKGFEQESNLPGIGLTNMKRRAIELGAVFLLESGPDKGTKVVIEL
jgi:signal transduction histidine kinase